MNDKPIAVGALLVNATIWGLAWWPIRQLTQAGMHSLWATALIYTVATIAIALAFRKTLTAGLRGWPVLGWLMLASGLTNASFNWAVTLTDVARVVLLFYLMPVWAALLARWLLREPLTAMLAVRICVALSGAALVLTDSRHPSGVGSWLADLLAVTAGITFAFNTVTLRRIAGHPRGAIALAMFGGGAVLPIVTALILAMAGHPLPVPATAGPWIAIVLATAVAYLLANLALQYGAARLPANTTSLIMLTEVAVAAASGALIAGEAMSGRALLGGALIVLAAASSLLKPAPRRGADRAHTGA